MSLTDPLQWIVVGILIMGGVALVLYVLYMLIRVLNKADKYFDAKAKESKPSSAA